MNARSNPLPRTDVLRSRPAPVAGAAAGPAPVHLTLKVPTTDALRVRRAMHRVLGDSIDIYVMGVDHRHHCTTLQLQTGPDRVEALMDAIMGDLIEAEFGPVRPCSAVVH